jgi:arsenate reductase
VTETILYGIPNCDTVKKARKWLDAQGVDFAFHDYKKQGADPARLAAWIETAGADVDAAKAVQLLQDNPSMIKRPIVEDGGALLVGFKEDEWSAHFS